MTNTGPDHDDFGGLHQDSARLVGRRRALQLLGGSVGLAGVLAACGSGSSGSAPSTSTTVADPATTSTAGDTATSTTAASGDLAGAEIPDETQGPYPADGSNGPNVLTDGAVVRSDIRTSFGELEGTAEGIPTVVELTVVDATSGSPLPGAALYLWQCTAEGQYSLYEVTDQNYLRGVQEADDAGRITFTTVYPGCYRGRWPHWHFEVYENLSEADAGSSSIKTSQIALPQASCETVYADSRYGSSADNLSQLSLQTDGIFRDGWTDQLATVTGDNEAGYTVSLLIRV